jgi:GNAT superfamily N-acetyltransferase
MLEALTLREGYFEDPNAFQALADLLQDVFGIDIGLQNRFGGPDPSSMPFGYFDEAGRCVANFSAFSMPLAIEGHIVNAVGYQSGAVRPEFRGRGLYRDLMHRAFAWADAKGFEAGILLTDKPDLYRSHGFQILPQFLFSGDFPRIYRSGEVHALTLNLTHADHAQLVADMLTNRQPVSGALAVQRQSEMFLLNALFDPQIRLSHLQSLDAVIAWKIDGDTLHVLDIAARQIPLLADICTVLGVTARRVAVYFPTDRLGWAGHPEPYSGSCTLMIKRLPLSAIPMPAMLSPMADF